MSHFLYRDKCPACGSIKFSELVNFPYTHPNIINYFNRIYKKFNYPKKNIEYEYLENANYCVVECSDCKLIYHLEVADETVMFKIYEEWTDIHHNFEINRSLHVPRYVFKHASEIFNILSLYNNKRADQYKVLDFGSGWSQWSRMAIAFGLDVYAHELSIEKKQFAEKFGIKTLTWSQLAEYQFDFINTEQVFEHLIEPLETLEYLRNCIHSDSIIKISVPNSMGLKDYLLNKVDWNQISDTDIFNAIAPLQHINAFTRDNLVKMIESKGYYVIPSQKYPHLNIVTQDTNDRSLFSTTKAILKKVIKKFKKNKKMEMDNSTYILIKRK